MDPSKKLKLFSEHRPRLMGLAYRMLGNITEAEDMVQETYIAWHRNESPIAHPRSWLFSVCSRKCIDHLRKAYKKREVYPGPWLPDPLPENTYAWTNVTMPLPEHKLNQSESVNTAFMLLLEKLKPAERAVFLLHEVFDYPYNEIAQWLGKTPAACRKTGQRARNFIKANESRFQANTEQNLTLISRFFQAAKLGQHDELKRLLSQESEFWSDSGGKVVAARRILHGISLKYSRENNLNILVTQISGRPGLLIFNKTNDKPVLESVISFEITEGQIQGVYAMRNPDKLSMLQKYMNLQN